ncbi:HlyD family secretion protein [Hyphococcus sp.]|uniref:HlyD family secretion protein n=1 Tax=Hyphococcus sp. TaxID=2038636 RepID=UPI003D100F7F
MTRSIIVISAAALLVSCSKASESRLTGYVEAETLYMAPQEGGAIENILVNEGDRVEAGAVLFRMRADKVLYQAEQAEAAAKAAEKRSEDSGSLAKAVAEAEANLSRVSADFGRTQKLYRDGYVAKARFDSDRAALTAAEAQLERARAEKEAAQEDYQSVEAQAGFVKQRLDDLTVSAPQAGSIERIYRRAGEVAAAGDPVVALLPPNNLKLKFYAPERILSSFAPGKELSFRCDGCDGGLKARVTYVAAEPQFTPPVIYSLDERDKLVFLVEARPLAPEGLRPGLPVDISIP